MLFIIYLIKLTNPHKFEYNINYYNIRNKCTYRIHKINSKLHIINIYGIKLWNNLNNHCTNLKYNSFKNIYNPRIFKQILS